MEGQGLEASLKMVLLSQPHSFAAAVGLNSLLVWYAVSHSQVGQSWERNISGEEWAIEKKTAKNDTKAPRAKGVSITGPQDCFLILCCTEAKGKKYTSPE